MCADRRLKASGAAVAVVILSLLSPAALSASGFRLVPSVGVSEEYNSNLFFSQVDAEDEWLRTVSPAVAVLYKTERLDLAMDANLQWLDYKENPDLDTTDYGASARFSYLVSDKFRLAGTGAFRKESQPDRFFEESGQVEAAAEDYRHDYGLSLEWKPTEMATVTASYSYEWLDYPAELNRDVTTHGGVLLLSRRLSSYSIDTRLLFNLSYTRGDYTDSTVDSYAATVGLFRAVHELWSVEASVGLLYTSTDFKDWTGLPKNDSTGFTGNASLMYHGEHLNGSFTLTHGVSPAYGTEGATLRTAAVLNLDRRFMHEIYGVFSAGVYRNSSDAGEFNQDEIDELSFQVRPGIRWEPSRYFSLEGSYRYSRVNYRTTGTDATQNVVYLQATLSYPFFEK